LWVEWLEEDWWEIALEVLQGEESAAAQGQKSAAAQGQKSAAAQGQESAAK
jgi:hypothetical protein